MPYIDLLDIDFHAAKDAETQRERRMVAIGCIDQAHYVVVYTWRIVDDGDLVRWIISARRSKEKERREYVDQILHNEGSSGGQAHRPGKAARHH